MEKDINLEDFLLTDKVEMAGKKLAEEISARYEAMSLPDEEKYKLLYEEYSKAHSELTSVADAKTEAMKYIDELYDEDEAVSYNGADKLATQLTSIIEKTAQLHGYSLVLDQMEEKLGLK